MELVMIEFEQQV